MLGIFHTAKREFVPSCLKRLFNRVKETLALTLTVKDPVTRNDYWI